MLVDEVFVLGVVEVHELVDLVHGCCAGVGGEGGISLMGAADEGAKVVVEVSDEEA